MVEATAVVRRARRREKKKSLEKESSEDERSTGRTERAGIYKHSPNAQTQFWSEANQAGSIQFVPQG
ncbi:hypothetical protein V5799_020835 [Amblyomma americanum]|uniref:Uncharacterized protein n=1 Tax=Amblyomma americanum TaxID=6943 RepID=A0AAQ4ESU4_AMBAM